MLNAKTHLPMPIETKEGEEQLFFQVTTCTLKGKPFKQWFNSGKPDVVLWLIEQQAESGYDQEEFLDLYIEGLECTTLQGREIVKEDSFSFKGRFQAANGLVFANFGEKQSTAKKEFLERMTTKGKDLDGMPIFRMYRYSYPHEVPQAQVDKAMLEEEAAPQAPSEEIPVSQEVPSTEGDKSESIEQPASGEGDPILRELEGYLGSEGGSDSTGVSTEAPATEPVEQQPDTTPEPQPEPEQPVKRGLFSFRG